MATNISRVDDIASQSQNLAAEDDNDEDAEEEEGGEEVDDVSDAVEYSRNRHEQKLRQELHISVLNERTSASTATSPPSVNTLTTPSTASPLLDLNSKVDMLDRRHEGGLLQCTSAASQITDPSEHLLLRYV